MVEYQSAIGAGMDSDLAYDYFEIKEKEKCFKKL